MKDIIFGSDFVYLIGHKDYKLIIKQNIFITLYIYENINFHKETNFEYKYPYYYIQIDNITFRIYEFVSNINDIIMYGYDDAIFINSDKKILSNAKFYQQLEKLYIPFEKQDNLKSLKSYILKIKQNNMISDSNIPKCYICKKYYNSKKILPNVVDSSSQFNWYKVNTNRDITFDYFDGYNKYDISADIKNFSIDNNPLIKIYNEESINGYDSYTYDNDKVILKHYFGMKTIPLPLNYPFESNVTKKNKKNTNLLQDWYFIELFWLCLIQSK